MTKKQTKTLDNLWSKIIKLRAKEKCEYCGNPTRLNSHHIFSRKNRSVRWDIANGVALCPLHHTLGQMSAHAAPIEFAEWLKEKRGITWYETLRLKAAQTVKVDYNLELLYLKQYESGKKTPTIQGSKKLTRSVK